MIPGGQGSSSSSPPPRPSAWAMWRYPPLPEGEVTLELTASTEMKQPLSIDVAETSEERIQRLISENPVIIFSRASCYMCHVMKKLFSTLEVHPTVIELEEEEIGVVVGQDSEGGGAPVVYIGGTRVGGLESLVALHLSGNLVPKLVEVGALWT